MFLQVLCILEGRGKGGEEERRWDFATGALLNRKSEKQEKK